MDYTSQKFEQTNKGRLFFLDPKEAWTIKYQGKLNIEGEQQRIIGISRKNADGQWITEIYKAIGTLKLNHEKINENDPHAKGVVNKLINSGAMQISAWKQTSEKGNQTVSLSVRNFDEPKQTPEDNTDHSL